MVRTTQRAEARRVRDLEAQAAKDHTRTRSLELAAQVVRQDTPAADQGGDLSGRPATGRTTRTGSRWSTAYARLVLFAPLAVAGWFQAHAIHDLLTPNWAVAVAFTASWEGAAAYVAQLYRRALLRGDSTIVLRLGMFVYAAGSYALLTQELRGHEAWLAHAIGVLTLSGIFLWSRHARDQHRDRLVELGLVDAQAPKMAALRWILCPIETPKAFRFGVRFSRSRLGPEVVLSEYRLWSVVGRPKQWPSMVQDHRAKSLTDVVRTTNLPGPLTGDHTGTADRDPGPPATDHGGDGPRSTPAPRSLPGPRPRRSGLAVVRTQPDHDGMVAELVRRYGTCPPGKERVCEDLGWTSRGRVQAAINAVKAGQVPADTPTTKEETA
jgi:hypothetical protein